MRYKLNLGYYAIWTEKNLEKIKWQKFLFRFANKLCFISIKLEQMANELEEEWMADVR